MASAGLVATSQSWKDREAEARDMIAPCANKRPALAGERGDICANVTSESRGNASQSSDSYLDHANSAMVPTLEA